MDVSMDSDQEEEMDINLDQEKKIVRESTIRGIANKPLVLTRK